MSENTNTIVLAADDATALALVDTIRVATNGAGKYVAYVKAHNVTRETVKYHAVALASFAYPNLDTVQTIKDENGNKIRTKYGNAVQAAGNGLRSALGKSEGAETDYAARLRKAAEAAKNHGVTVEDMRAILADILA